jgi:hypothetical protein
LAKATVFETGTNQWRRYESWPPPNAKPKSLYFRADGRLSFDAPPESGEVFDEFLSDPAKPVPYINKIGIGMDREYMVADQRFAARRPDVLVYVSDVLTADVTIAGAIEPELFVSTTGTDADWIVKLIDVYPDDFSDPDPNPTGQRMAGFQQLIRGDVMRGKFRNSLSRPEPFTPGKPTPVKFEMPDSYHTFRPGHRIMVQVQSSWFPLVDRNPQTFVDINRATPQDFQKATHRVYRAGGLQSHVGVRVLEGS